MFMNFFVGLAFTIQPAGFAFTPFLAAFARTCINFMLIAPAIVKVPTEFNCFAATSSMASTANSTFILLSPTVSPTVLYAFRRGIAFGVDIVRPHGIVAFGAFGIVAFGPCVEARAETFMNRIRLFIVIGEDCMPIIYDCNSVLLELEWPRV